MEDKKKKVEELTTINFSITKCPMKVFKRFSEFCKNETNDNYSFGLKLLVDGMEGNLKEALLYEQFMELKVRIDELEELLANKPETEPKRLKPKTMGSKNKLA